MLGKVLHRRILLLLLFVFTNEAAAVNFNFTTDQSTLRCLGGIISVGDVDRTVINKCGEPRAVTKREADSYNIWIYYFGASKFMYYLGFLHGKLQRIVSAPCNPVDPDCFDVR